MVGGNYSDYTEDQRNSYRKQLAPHGGASRTNHTTWYVSTFYNNIQCIIRQHMHYICQGMGILLHMYITNIIL